MKPRHVLALACLLPMLVPGAAADFPWDEARDAHWAGERALLAGRNVTRTYLDAGLLATNATYADAAETARETPPPTTPVLCLLHPVHGCAAGGIADRFVASTTENTTRVGDDFRDLAARIAVDYAHRSSESAIAAYRATRGALP